MTKILHIIANPKKEEESYSRRLAKEFLNEYKKKHSEDVVETLDLYKIDIPYLDSLDLQASIYKGGQNLTEEEQKKMSFKEKLIDQLMSADKIVVTTPFWNLGIPAILKGYIDHIVVAGKTFQYGAKGPEGLITGKKICFIIARGGDYGNIPDLEYGIRYLKTIFGFMGITDQMEITFDNTSRTDELNKRFEEELNRVKEKAKTF